MKKSIKRALSLLLALTMVLSLGLPAYAVGAPAEDEVVISEEPIALPEQEPVEEPVEKPVTLPIGAGKKIDFTEEEEIISNDLIVDFSDVEDELVVEAEAAPAKTFTYSESATGFTVEVSAPAGALPLGTEMFVDRLVDLSAVQAAVDNAEDLNGSVQLAADISFWLEGKEIEPAEGAKLVVRMSAPEIETIASPIIVHIPDGENAVPEIVEQLSSGDVMMADTVSFEAASFSVYAIVSDDVPGTPRVTYHFLTEVVDGAAEPYTFLNRAGDYVDYQIVKANDGTWEKLQNPGEPVVGLDKNFLGWFIVEKNGDTYSYTENIISFDENGEAEPPVKTDTTTGDKDVYVAPRYGEAFIVTFWDKTPEAAEAEGVPLHIVARRVVYTSVRVDNVSVPSKATEVLTGWTSDDYEEGSDWTTYTLLEKTEWDNITKSFNLYPLFSEGHWLRFSGGPAGSGAGYNEAIFVTANTTASELANLGTVTREGYTFDGWFYNGFDSPESDRASSASGAASDAADLLAKVQALGEGEYLTLYAHWTGNEVGYKYATWFENADDTNFAYGELVDLEGRAGDPTAVEPPEVEGFHIYGSDLTNYPDETDPKYTLKQDTIKGDGTTIVNVYYARNVYQVKFYSDGSYESTTDTTGDLYGRSGSSYYPLVRFSNNWYIATVHNGTYYYNTTYYYKDDSRGWVQIQRSTNGRWQYRTGTSGSWTYYPANFTPDTFYDFTYYGNNTRYKLVPGDEIEELRITAKYGADIHDQWPGAKEGTEEYGASWTLEPGGSVFMTSITTMPLNGVNYYQMEGGDYPQNTIFMTQNIDGSNNFTQYNQAPASGSRGVHTTADDYTAIKGFHLNAYSQDDANAIKENATGDNDAVYDANFSRSAEVGSYFLTGTTTEPQSGGYGWNNYQDTVNGYYTLYFYYLRNKYTVTFNTQKSGAATPAALTDIFYEANIAQAKSTQIAALNQQYVPGETKVTITGEGTYVFQGWYDNADGMGKPFNFDQKMPAGNITLYAKWERVYYLIQIDPNGGEILPGIDEVTYTWLQYGDTIERYNIRRDFVETTSSYAGQKYYYFELLASEDEHRHDEEGYYYSGLRKGFYIKVEDAASKEAFMAAYPSYAGEYADSNWAVIEPHINKTVVYREATTDDYYSFVGWYKATINADDTLTYTENVYNFEDIVTDDTAIYAKWRRSGLFNVQYHMDNAPAYGTIGNELMKTDTGYADQAVTKITYTPERTGSHDTEVRGYVFVGWKLAKPDGFDAAHPENATFVSDTLYKQGDDFTVNSAYADDHQTLHLVAFYEPVTSDPNVPVVTSLTFEPNFPAGATGTSGTTSTINDLPINTKLDLGAESNIVPFPDGDRTVTIPVFTAFGYEQIGWNTQADGSGEPFGMTDVIGLDNLNKTNNGTPNTLYAIWGPVYFYVYQSSNNKVTRVPLAEYANETYDLTQHIDTMNYLYGGYYRDYAGKSDGFVAASLTYNNDVATDNGTNAKGYTGKNVTWNLDDAYKPSDEDFTGAGNAIKPVANTVYYIKEVPGANYLKHMMKFTYKTVTGKIGTAWLVTNADDANYDDIGFEITEKGKVGNNVGVKAEKMYIRAANTDTTKAYKVSDEIADDKFTSLFGQYGKLMSYKLVYNDPTAGTDNAVAPLPGVNPVNDLTAGSVVRNYWVTLDGLKVTSTMVRTYKQVENTYSGERPTTVPDEAGSQIMKPDKTSA